MYWHDRVMNAVTTFEDLSGAQKVVLMCLAAYADVEGRNAWPTIDETVTLMCGHSARQTWRHVRALLERGHIRHGDQSILPERLVRRGRPQTVYDVALDEATRQQWQTEAAGASQTPSQSAGRRGGKAAGAALCGIQVPLWEGEFSDISADFSDTTADFSDAHVIRLKTKELQTQTNTREELRSSPVADRDGETGGAMTNPYLEDDPQLQEKATQRVPFQRAQVADDRALQVVGGFADAETPAEASQGHTRLQRPAKPLTRGQLMWQLSEDFRFQATRLHPGVQHNTAAFTKELNRWMRQSNVDVITVRAMMRIWFANPANVTRLTDQRPSWAFVAQLQRLHAKVKKSSVSYTPIPVEDQIATLAWLEGS